jgi:hypothetical protein
VKYRPTKGQIFMAENLSFSGVNFIVFSGEKDDEGKAVISLRTRHANRVGYGAVCYVKPQTELTEVNSYFAKRGLALYERGTSKSGNSQRYGILNAKLNK